MKLTESLKGLICEIASIDSVIDAIKQKQKVIQVVKQKQVVQTVKQQEKQKTKKNKLHLKCDCETTD